jgi:hypothetical protein
LIIWVTKSSESTKKCISRGIISSPLFGWKSGSPDTILMLLYPGELYRLLGASSCKSVLSKIVGYRSIHVDGHFIYVSTDKNFVNNYFNVLKTIGFRWSTLTNYNGEPRNIPNIYLIRIFSAIWLKRQLALSNYNEIEIDLFIVFPSPTKATFVNFFLPKLSSFIDWCYYTQVSYTGSWEPLVVNPYFLRSWDIDLSMLL